MRKSILFLTMILGGMFVFPWFSSVYAQDQDERKADKVSSTIDQESRRPGESQRVETRLEQKYNVSDARIDSLRNQKLGFGEINTVLSLAKQMPGGINDQNIQKIMTLRQGQAGHKEGWGEVARDLNLKLKSAVRDLDDINRGIRHDERAESQTHFSAQGSQGVESHHSFEGFHGDAGFRGGFGMGHQR